MTQPMSVQLDALTSYAQAAAAISQGCSDIRSSLGCADVTDDSFGLLPESREVAETYATWTDDGLTALRDGVDVFRDISDAMRQVRKNYEGADEFSQSLTTGGAP